MASHDAHKLLCETQQHYDETAERLASMTRQQVEISTEALKLEIRLITKGLARLEEQISREIGRLEETVDRGFANTQALLRRH